MIISIMHTFLMAMLIRIELIDPSINTLSFSLRLITTGINNNSLLFLYKIINLFKVSSKMIENVCQF
jgi:hypothetical protein